MAFLYLRYWISIQSSMELFYEGILTSPSLILVLFSPISLVQLKLGHWDQIPMFERIPRHTMHHYIRSKCPWVDLWMTLVHDLDHTAIKKDSVQVRLVVTWKREAHYWKIPILMKNIVQKVMQSLMDHSIPDVLRFESANMLPRRACISWYCWYWSSQSRHLLHTNTNANISHRGSCWKVPSSYRYQDNSACHVVSVQK